jgi:hypothetical protein
LPPPPPPPQTSEYFDFSDRGPMLDEHLNVQDGYEASPVSW